MHFSLPRSIRSCFGTWCSSAKRENLNDLTLSCYHGNFKCITRVTHLYHKKINVVRMRTFIISLTHTRRLYLGINRSWNITRNNINRAFSLFLGYAIDRHDALKCYENSNTNHFQITRISLENQCCSNAHFHHFTYSYSSIVSLAHGISLEIISIERFHFF